MRSEEGDQETQRRCARLYSWVSPDTLVALTHASELSHKLMCVRVMQELARQAVNIVEHNSAGDGNSHNAFPCASDRSVLSVYETPAELNYCFHHFISTRYVYNACILIHLIPSMFLAKL